MLTIFFILIILSVIGISYGIYAINTLSGKKRCKCSNEDKKMEDFKLNKSEIEKLEEYSAVAPFPIDFDEAKKLKIREDINKMNITQFDSKISKTEGRKKQTHVGNVREVRKLIGLEISKISKEDLLEIAKKYNGKDLLTKIVKRLK